MPGATNGDWDYNGNVEKQYPTNLRCADRDPFVLGCNAAGFTAIPRGAPPART